MLLQQGGGTQVLPNFGDSLLFMHTPVDAAVSQPQEGRVPTLPNFWVPIYFYAYTLCRRSTKFDVVTHVGEVRVS